jgi:hypothetical protein
VAFRLPWQDETAFPLAEFAQPSVNYFVSPTATECHPLASNAWDNNMFGESGVDTKMAETGGLLCEDCGEALSTFLQEMAEHNAKVTACPKCGKQHPFEPAKAARPVAKPRPRKRTTPTHLASNKLQST